MNSHSVSEDEAPPGVRQAAIEAGADGFVLTRAIAMDLLPAIEAVLAGSRADARERG